MKKILFLAIFICTNTAYAGTIYMWKDANGVRHFSNAPTDKTVLNQQGAKEIQSYDYQEAEHTERNAKAYKPDQKNKDNSKKEAEHKYKGKSKNQATHKYKGKSKNQATYKYKGKSKQKATYKYKSKSKQKNAHKYKQTSMK